MEEKDYFFDKPYRDDFSLSDSEKYIPRSPYFKRIGKFYGRLVKVSLLGIAVALVMEILSDDEPHRWMYAGMGAFFLIFAAVFWILRNRKRKNLRKNAGKYVFAEPLEITVERTYRHVSGNPFFSLHIGFEITFRTPSGAIVREKTRNCYAKKEEAFVMNAFREKKIEGMLFFRWGKRFRPSARFLKREDGKEKSFT